MYKVRPLPLLVFFLCSSLATSQTTWYVDPSGSGDFSKIQDAIDDGNVIQGDTVIVRDGYYPENIDFRGKGITLQSENGPDFTIIDGGFLDSVVKFQSGETVATVLEGFLIVNGYSAKGAGIYIKDSSPSVRRNHIDSNIATSEGGGVYVYGSSSSPEILENEIRDNLAIDGAGFYLSSCSAMLKGNSVFSNISSGRGGGGFLSSSDLSVILDSKIKENTAVYGGGLYLSDSSLSLESVKLFGNVTTASYSSTGTIHIKGCSPELKRVLIASRIGKVHTAIFLDRYSGNYCSPMLEHCTIVGHNFALYGDNSQHLPKILNSILWGNNSHIVSCTPLATYSCVEGASGQSWFVTGCIDQDPLFVDEANGDYRLKQYGSSSWAQSPCVDAGNPFTTEPGFSTRIDGAEDIGRLDMGYHSIAQTLSPTLSVSNFVSGQTSTVDIQGCTPNGTVYFAWSAHSGTPIRTPFGAGFVGPYHTLLSYSADSSGKIAVNIPVPAGFTGLTVWFHGADPGLGVMLQPLAKVIQ